MNNCPKSLDNWWVYSFRVGTNCRSHLSKTVIQIIFSSAVPSYLQIFFVFKHIPVFVVEGDTGAPVSNPDGYQDALSKKQRRPQEDERRRKEQGAAVS